MNRTERPALAVLQQNSERTKAHQARAPSRYGASKTAQRPHGHGQQHDVMRRQQRARHERQGSLGSISTSGRSARGGARHGDDERALHRSAGTARRVRDSAHGNRSPHHGHRRRGHHQRSSSLASWSGRPARKAVPNTRSSPSVGSSTTSMSIMAYDTLDSHAKDRKSTGDGGFHVGDAALAAARAAARASVRRRQEALDAVQAGLADEAARDIARSSPSYEARRLVLRALRKKQQKLMEELQWDMGRLAALVEADGALASGQATMSPQRGLRQGRSFASPSAMLRSSRADRATPSKKQASSTATMQNSGSPTTGRHNARPSPLWEREASSGGVTVGSVSPPRSHSANRGRGRSGGAQENPRASSRRRSEGYGSVQETQHVRIASPAPGDSQSSQVASVGLRRVGTPAFASPRLALQSFMNSPACSPIQRPVWTPMARMKQSGRGTPGSRDHYKKRAGVTTSAMCDSPVMPRGCAAAHMCALGPGRILSLYANAVGRVFVSIIKPGSGAKAKKDTENKGEDETENSCIMTPGSAQSTSRRGTTPMSRRQLLTEALRLKGRKLYERISKGARNRRLANKAREASLRAGSSFHAGTPTARRSGVFGTPSYM